MASESSTPPKSNPALASAFRSLGRSLFLRGVLEIALGVLLVLYTAHAIKILTIVIGAALGLSGLFQLLIAVRSKDSKKHWALINAVALLVFGIFVIWSPLLADKLWIIVIGIWMIVSAANELFSGGWRRIWGILSCVLSVAIGVCFIVLPFYALDLIAKISGWVMIVSGILVFSAGIDLHSASKKV